MADKKVNLSGGFVGGTFQTIAAGVCATAAGKACFIFGLTVSPQWDDLRNWPVYVLLFGVFLVLGPVGRQFWYYTKLWIAARRLRRLGANRLTILLGNFEGDDATAIKDRIQVELNNVFGKAADRSFSVHELPLVLQMPPPDAEPWIAKQVVQKGQRWLKRSNADLFIWGRALNHAQATIYFLRGAGDPLDDKKAPELSPIDIYKFDLAPEKFSAYAAEILAFAAVISLRPIFEPERIQSLNPESALKLLALVRRLEGLSLRPAKSFPKNLIAMIRAKYRSASEALGRKGILEGWQRAFQIREQELSQIDKQKCPDDFAVAARSLAIAMSEAGEQFGENSLLEKAIGLYREVLGVQPRERVPLDWAMTQNNLGNALKNLGQREPGTARLEEAIVAYRDALKERTRERVPLDWAQTQNNLGNALQVLGQRESGTARLDEAIAAYREAFDVLEDSDDEYHLQLVRSNLQRALAEIPEKTWR